MTIVALSTGLRRGELLGCAGRTSSCSNGASTSGRRSSGTRSRRRRAGRDAGTLGPATSPPRRSRSSSRQPAPGARVVVFCAPGARDAARRVEAHRVRSEGARARRGTRGFRPWHGMRHTALPKPRPRECPRCSCRRRPGTRKARRRSGTCTRRKRATRTPPSSRRPACSPRGRKSGRKSPYGAIVEREKPCVSRAFPTPRVGLEPTTLRLTAGCSAN